MASGYQPGWGYLLGGPHRIAGAMFVMQRRRKKVACEAISSFYPVCFSDVQEETQPLHPGNQYWHTYNNKASAYVLPLDLGRISHVMKDSGRCDRSRACERWFDSPATSSFRLVINTFNGHVRRWGLGAISFSFDLGGKASVTLEAISSADPLLTYGLLTRPNYALITLESLLLLLLGYAAGTSALACGRSLVHHATPRPEFMLLLLTSLMMLATEAVWLGSVLVLGSTAPGPTPDRDIRDFPSDFTASIELAQWIELMGTTSTLHSSIGGITAVCSARSSSTPSASTCACTRSSSPSPRR